MIRRSFFFLALVLCFTMIAQAALAGDADQKRASRSHHSSGTDTPYLGDGNGCPDDGGDDSGCGNPGDDSGDSGGNGGPDDGMGGGDGGSSPDDGMGGDDSGGSDGGCGGDSGDSGPMF